MGKSRQKKLDVGSVDSSSKPTESSATKKSEEKKAPIRLLLEFDDKHDPAVMDLVEAITARTMSDDDSTYEEVHRRGRVQKPKTSQSCAVWRNRRTKIENRMLLRDEDTNLQDLGS